MPTVSTTTGNREPSRPNLVLFFGGPSEEHAVSLASARTLMSAFQQLPYRLWPVAVTRQRGWYLVSPQHAFLCQNGHLSLNPAALTCPVALVPASPHAQLVALSEGRVLCSPPDVIFPIIHGQDGEDGAIQGLAQLYNIPCCGAALAGSALGIDKVLTKKILLHHGLPVAPFISWSSGHPLPGWQQSRAQLGGGNLFVKPACQGSSVGVSRVTQESEWEPALLGACRYGQTVLIEQSIQGRELECALLQQQGEVKVSGFGEICLSEGLFYDYQHKYVASPQVSLSLEPHIPAQSAAAMRQAAREAFLVLGLAGFARIDFFLVADGRFRINEVNTLPGFTDSSMFPRLWQKQGLSLPEVLAAIVEHALGT